jgi:ribose 1,5-bisphosphokinase PhnN
VGNREQEAFVAAREVLEVRNDGALAEAGAQLLQAFERLVR